MKKILLEIQNEDKKNPYTDKELSEILGISRGDIVQFRKNNNIPNSRERRKNLLKNEILNILEDDFNITERKLTETIIERGFNISRSAISSIIKSENLKEKIKKYNSDDELNEGLELKEELQVENVLKINKKEEIENEFESLIGHNGSLEGKGYLS